MNIHVGSPDNNQYIANMRIQIFDRTIHHDIVGNCNEPQQVYGIPECTPIFRCNDAVLEIMI